MMNMNSSKQCTGEEATKMGTRSSLTPPSSQQSTWTILQNEIQLKLQTTLEGLSKNGLNEPKSALATEDSRNLLVESLSKDLVSLVQARVPSSSSTPSSSSSSLPLAATTATSTYSGSLPMGSASEQIVAAAAAVAASSRGVDVGLNLAASVASSVDGPISGQHSLRSPERIAPVKTTAATASFKTVADAIAEAASTSSPPREHVWALRVKELKEFKATHGHCLVPKQYQSNPSLGRWVGRQRGLYKLKMEGKSNRLSDERIEELDALDFAWDATSQNVKRSSNVLHHRQSSLASGEEVSANADAASATETTLRHLSTKKRKASKVEAVKKEEESLSSFHPNPLKAHVPSALPSPNIKVGEERKKETKFSSPNLSKAGVKHSSRSAHQNTDVKKESERSTVHQKRSIDESTTTEEKDDCHISDKKRKISRDAQWNLRFNELLDYKAKHGHCRVPRTVPILGRWVKKQREQCKLKREDKINGLSDDRFRRLSEIGFTWDFPRPDDWETRFQQLEQYVKEHGNAMVPKKYDPNPSLGRWVGRQRTNFRQLREGKPSTLTEAKFKKLSSLGFVWCASNPAGISEPANSNTNSSIATAATKQKNENASHKEVAILQSSQKASAHSSAEHRTESFIGTATFDAATAAAIAATVEDSSSDIPTRVTML